MLSFTQEQLNLVAIYITLKELHRSLHVMLKATHTIFSQVVDHLALKINKSKPLNMKQVNFVMIINNK